MLARLRFSDRSPDSAATTAGATPIDGVWHADWTLARLSRSPLLMDAHEVNDENWGTFRISFKRGQFILEQNNARESSTNSGSFTVDGDVLTIQDDNGERFEMRWSIQGDQLILTRDEALGIAPTPFVIEPWDGKS